MNRDEIISQLEDLKNFHVKHFDPNNEFNNERISGYNKAILNIRNKSDNGRTSAAFLSHIRLQHKRQAELYCYVSLHTVEYSILKYSERMVKIMDLAIDTLIGGDRSKIKQWGVI